MKYAILITILFTSGCAFDELAPDRMNVGVIRYDADGDVWGNDGVSGAHGEAQGYSYGLSFGWSFGSQQPRAERDFDLMERAMTRALTAHAQAMPKPESPDINIGTHAPNQTSVQTSSTDDAGVELNVHNEWFHIFDRYAELDIASQIVIAFVLICILVVLIFYRQILLKAFMFWRSKGQHKSDPLEQPTDLSSDRGSSSGS